MKENSYLPEEWHVVVEEAMEAYVSKEEFQAFLIEYSLQKAYTKSQE
ncbi:hypothetical protein [Guptibacillus hwajinpoensis]|nr:hypothetical protein [Pseudalkalibacillus hwajinpoensis]